MLGGVLPAWHFKMVALVLALMLSTMVLPATALADDDSAEVTEAGIEQSSTAIPLPERRPANAQESLNSVSDARQVSGNRRVRVARSRRRVRVAGRGRRSCTYLGCRGFTILGVGY